MKLLNTFPLLLIIILINGCASERLLHTWSSSQDYDKNFENILVMGLVNNVNLRSDIESSLVYAARDANVHCGDGMSIFPPELGKPFEDIERAKARMRDKGYDGVLTVALIDIKAERYVPSDVNYEPLIYYDRFRNYYYRTYELVYRPGYYSQYSRYFIETNFYELKTGSLVWSGRSRVFDPGEFDSFIQDHSKVLFKELKVYGVIQ